MKKILLLLSLVVFMFLIAIGQADAGKFEKKISAALRAQIAAKNDYVKSPTSEKFKELKEMGLQEARNQIVFLHSKRKPSKSQLKYLTGLGMKIFADSWVAPVGNHPTGYLIAKIPVNKINRLAKKSFVTKLETAERILAPQNDEAATSPKSRSVAVNIEFRG